jgi:hypothetical protein
MTHAWQNEKRLEDQKLKEFATRRVDLERRLASVKKAQHDKQQVLN